MSPPGPTTPWRHFPAVLVAVGWGAFSAYRVWQAVLGPPATWQDSLAYRAVSAHPLFSAALWTGSRSPGVPLLMKATRQLDHYVLAQALKGQDVEVRVVAPACPSA